MPILSRQLPKNATFPKLDTRNLRALDYRYSYINPYVHKLEIYSIYDKVKFYLLTCLLVPVRIVGVVTWLAIAWVLSYIGLYGLSIEQLNRDPLIGWRKKFRSLVRFAMRMVYASCSLQYITQKGERASVEEAPILVVAPHSSYFDSVFIVAGGLPSIVARADTANMPLLGKIVSLCQPIYVQRGDKNSHRTTINEILTRVRSQKGWSQVAIFPEGTCTNHAALIQFKKGAFIAGLPVQPVLIRYPNKHDTFTWTWQGPSLMRLFWLTLAQFHSRCELEFLPVYKPSNAEKQNPSLYAHNVRNLMAKALNVPTTEYCFSDALLIERATKWNVPQACDIVEFERKVQKLGLLEARRHNELIKAYQTLANSDKLDALTFAELLQVDIFNKNFQHLFGLLDSQHKGFISLKRYLLCMTFCRLKNDQQVQFLRAITPLYADSMIYIKLDNFKQLMQHAGKLATEQGQQLFEAIDKSGRGFIAFNDFENHVVSRKEFKYLFDKGELLRH